MVTEMGEFLVGAYLTYIEGCDVVSYNVRIKSGGREAQNEIDVVGLRFKDKTAYLCEVTTHLKGVLYKDVKETIKRIRNKHVHQKSYAKQFLKDFPNQVFMFWSPYVPVGMITVGLGEIDGLDLVINENFSKKLNDLSLKASEDTSDQRANPFFRALQIISCAQGRDSKESTKK